VLLGLLSFVVLDRTGSQAGRRGLCRLSHIGMNQLITNGAAAQTDKNSPSFRLLSSGNISAVLMLPQLENIFQHALEDLQRCSSQSSHGVLSACSPRGSVDSGSSVHRSCEDTVVALRQLLALVRYSRHVRQAITAIREDNDTASKADHIAPVQVSSCYTGNGVKWLAASVIHIL